MINTNKCYYSVTIQHSYSLLYSVRIPCACNDTTYSTDAKELLVLVAIV